MAKRKTARDLILGRKKVPSAEDVLGRVLPGISRKVGSSSGRQFGEELQRSIDRGDVPPKHSGGPRVYNPNARRDRERAQARSPLLLEAIRRRLTGDRIGSPKVTDEDFEQLRALDTLSRDLDTSFLSKTRRAIQERLKGQIGFVQKRVLQAGGFLTESAASVFSGAKAVIAKLRGDELKEKLKGFGILGKRDIPTGPSSLPGIRSTTPYQMQQMTGVSSSNVASVGWEPHYQDEPIDNKTLGTLFIQFRNGWLYKYVNAPFWLYEAILRAPSKGKAVWGLLRRGLYPDGVPYGSAAVEGYERIR